MTVSDRLFDHVEDARVPALRRGAYRGRDFRNFLVHAVKQAVQVFHDPADKQFFQPFSNLFPEKIQSAFPPFRGASGEAPRLNSREER